MQNQSTCVGLTGCVRVPAELVDLLRDGLRSQIAAGAQRIASVDGQLGAREHPERYLDPLRRMDASRALMEEIGWSTPATDLDVDVRVHGQALSEALAEEIALHADMLDDGDPEEEEREGTTRNANALQALAFTVLLKTQAHILRTASPPSDSG